MILVHSRTCRVFVIRDKSLAAAVLRPQGVIQLSKQRNKLDSNENSFTSLWARQGIDAA
jgi:hypothetical protein